MKNKPIFISLLTFSVIILVACAQNPTELAKNYAATYNTHDVKKIVALYSDDAVFEVAGKLTLQGRISIRNLTQYDSVLHIHMTLSNIEMNFDTVSFHLAETNDWYKTAGIGEAHYNLKLVFKEGLITHVMAERMPETSKAVDQVLSPLVNWAKENKPEVLKEMMPEGVFIYNAENATKTLALLRQWKESSQ